MVGPPPPVASETPPADRARDPEFLESSLGSWGLIIGTVEPVRYSEELQPKVKGVDLPLRPFGPCVVVPVDGGSRPWVPGRRRAVTVGNSSNDRLELVSTRKVTGFTRDRPVLCPSGSSLLPHWYSAVEWGSVTVLDPME